MGRLAAVEPARADVAHEQRKETSADEDENEPCLHFCLLIGLEPNVLKGFRRLPVQPSGPSVVSPFRRKVAKGNPRSCSVARGGELLKALLSRSQPRVGLLEPALFHQGTARHGFFLRFML